MLLNIYKNIFSFLYKDKKLISVILLVFVEAFVYDLLHAEADISQYLLYHETTRPNYSSLFSFILFENIRALFQPIFIGFIPFFLGAMCYIFSITNFIVSSCKYILDTTPISVFLAGIIPHGIFELPAIILSSILSVIISKETTLAFLSIVTGKRFDDPKSIFIKHTAKETILFVIESILFLIIPMVFIGAFIESFVTSRIIETIA